MPQAVRRVDTAIIGGGVAGAYCAWRLAGSDGAGSIAVFERQDRVAGRLWSVPVNPVQGQVAELGGMRIAPNHGIARDLIGHLGLPTMPFVASGDNAFVYLRGVRKRRADIRAAGDFPYDLPDHLARMTPEEMTAHLSALHGYDVPLPVDARVRWWGHDGEAANWLWGVGGSVWDLSREVRHPVAATPIHICGDCFSLNQGWVQGALQSAELVLREAYGMHAASWMSESATLGDDVHPWEGM